MEILLPYHNYVVVTPNGDMNGFEEEIEAREYIAGYYIDKVDKYSEDFDKDYEDSEDYDSDPLSTTIDICEELGCYEGDCRIFDLDSLIEVIRDSGIFEEEKEELISKLMEEEIDLNVNDYQLDDFLLDAKELPRSND